MKNCRVLSTALLLVVLLAPLPGPVQALDVSPPATTVRLIFIHHSTGGYWLADLSEDQPSGGLGTALMNNNYFVSATNYDWGPDSIGSRTDIPNWPEWFTGPNSSTILAALYAESGQNVGDYGDWSRLPTNPDPGGENEIIMFKSCFPNSDLYGNPDDPPAPQPNDELTVANAKAVYNNILTYFATRQDKLFVVITAPPLQASDTAPDRAANARAFNNWLVNDWLSGYPYYNVAVFDYYNTLTSNGSTSRIDDPETTEDPNDAGWTDGNHHRWWNSAIQHIRTISNNYSAYPSGDSHPTSAGHRKATAEFVPLLNLYYHRWKSGANPVPSLRLTVPNGGEAWPIGSQQQIQWTTTGSVPQVSLAYSTDGFSTAHTIASSIDNSGIYTWVTPLTPTTTARVRVASVISPTTIFDDSDADFTLFDLATLTYTLNLPLILRDSGTLSK
jgi:hypothetical protein